MRHALVKIGEPILSVRSVDVRPRYHLLMSQLGRVVSDPTICHGQPIIRGLRYPVSMILELMASGMSSDEILADYLDLEADDLVAALEFGALTAGRYRVLPFDAA